MSEVGIGDRFERLFGSRGVHVATKKFPGAFWEIVRDDGLGMGVIFLPESQLLDPSCYTKLENRMIKPKYSVGDKFDVDGEVVEIFAISPTPCGGEYEYWMTLPFERGMLTFTEHGLDQAEKIEPFFAVGRKYRYGGGYLQYECTNLVDIKGEAAAILVGSDNEKYVYGPHDFKRMREV